VFVYQAETVFESSFHYNEVTAALPELDQMYWLKHLLEPVGVEFQRIRLQNFVRNQKLLIY